MSGDEEVEDIGFDEESAFDIEDLVSVVGPDGVSVPCVLLAVIEHEGGEYAMLTPQTDAEGDDDLELLLAAYQEDPDGTAHFLPIQDDGVYEQVRAFCATLIETEAPPPGSRFGGGPLPEA